MVIIIYLFVLFHSVLMPVQEEPQIEIRKYSDVICAGDQLIFGNRSMEFKKIISDSRCPSAPMITCIWAGEVKVLVEFYENGKSKGTKIIKSSNIAIGDYFNTEGLKLQRFGVSPYPETWSSIEPEDYRLSLEVTEKMEVR
jgi:hypothetical protein